MWLKLVTEKLVRKRMAERLAVRQRPGTSQEGAVLRGDVPSSGPSFPSGHIILVAAIGCVVAPSIGAAWWWVPAFLALLVMLGRVYVGAHNRSTSSPDSARGMLLGGAIAVFVN
jgi:undecaprenyl-diphosphatase